MARQVMFHVTNRLLACQYFHTAGDRGLFSREESQRARIESLSSWEIFFFIFFPSLPFAALNREGDNS